MLCCDDCTSQQCHFHMPIDSSTCRQLISPKHERSLPLAGAAYIEMFTKLQTNVAKSWLMNVCLETKSPFAKRVDKLTKISNFYLAPFYIYRCLCNNEVSTTCDQTFCLCMQFDEGDKNPNMVCHMIVKCIMSVKYHTTLTSMNCELTCMLVTIIKCPLTEHKQCILNQMRNYNACIIMLETNKLGIYLLVFSKCFRDGFCQ